MVMVGLLLLADPSEVVALQGNAPCPVVVPLFALEHLFELDSVTAVRQNSFEGLIQEFRK